MSKFKLCKSFEIKISLEQTFAVLEAIKIRGKAKLERNAHSLTSLTAKQCPNNKNKAIIKILNASVKLYIITFLLVSCNLAK